MSDPFHSPADKGQPPYWLREWDPVQAAEHLERLKRRALIQVESQGTWLELAPRGTPP